MPLLWPLWPKARPRSEQSFLSPSEGLQERPGPGLRVNIQGNWKQDPLLESPIRAGIWCKQQGGRWSTRISASATASLGGGQGPCALTLVVPEGFH